MVNSANQADGNDGLVAGPTLTVAGAATTLLGIKQVDFDEDQHTDLIVVDSKGLIYRVKGDGGGFTLPAAPIGTPLPDDPDVANIAMSFAVGNFDSSELGLAIS